MSRECTGSGDICPGSAPRIGVGRRGTRYGRTPPQGQRLITTTRNLTTLSWVYDFLTQGVVNIGYFSCEATFFKSGGFSSNVIRLEEVGTISQVVGGQGKENGDQRFNSPGSVTPGKGKNTEFSEQEAFLFKTRRIFCFKTMQEQDFTYEGIQFTTNVYSPESLRYAHYEFNVLDDDIFNVTYPKSGTNWMIEILNLIKHKGDVTLSSAEPIYERSPWVETLPFKDKMNALTHPRIISSHLPVHIFPKSFFKSKAKVIYTVRNPKDVFISNYYFTKMLQGFKKPESFQEHLQNFLEGNVAYASWFDHIQEWMKMKDDDRFFFVTYEELLQDLRGSVVKICKFLRQDLDSEAIDSVVKHSTFKAMAENKMSNWSTMSSEVLDHTKGSFLRKGIII
ncbi:sulfotransferase family cytosolic 2B member 1-like [Pelobates cultripes]|uniref:Sulfotransferase n=1 Tax=Pelobates cultripes TaxID=61616 RepID=A0AAD1WNG4_PELCU|nr:sulfotransferase family cytosolic 2B member 1-like [Pelobates cultripes]